MPMAPLSKGRGLRERAGETLKDLVCSGVRVPHRKHPSLDLVCMCVTWP